MCSSLVARQVARRKRTRKKVERRCQRPDSEQATAKIPHYRFGSLATDRFGQFHWFRSNSLSFLSCWFRATNLPTCMYLILVICCSVHLTLVCSHSLFCAGPTVIDPFSDWTWDTGVKPYAAVILQISSFIRSRFKPYKSRMSTHYVDLPFSARKASKFSCEWNNHLPLKSGLSPIFKLDTKNISSR